MIRKLYTQIGWGKFLLLLAFSVVFGLSERTSGASGLSAHVLAALNDQYYFIFAILPILLFVCGSVMEDDAEIVISRYGTYSHYFVAKWRSLGMLCSGLWLVQMVMLFLTGLGLQVTANEWDNLSGGSLLKEIVSLLAEKLFRALAGFALSGGIFVDWLLAYQPIGSVAGAFSFAILCNQSPACFVCSFRFEYQITDYVRTTSLLLDWA